MCIKEVLKNYNDGMAAYDRCHQQTFVVLWEAWKSEAVEFIAEPSLSEFWDTLHAVYKHGDRFAKSGCIRSSRNCEGKCRILISQNEFEKLI